MPVRWTTPASADLVKIEAYLDAIDPTVALKAVDAIVRSTGRLVDHPAIGPRLRRDTRSIGVAGTPYRLVYRLRPDGVEMLRVRHVRENWRV